MSENLPLIKLIGERFIQRRDAKAEQYATGSWSPVKERDAEGKMTGPLIPFGLQDFEDHLAGTRTFGHYLTDGDGLCKLFAFDIDLRAYQFERTTGAPNEQTTKIVDDAGAIEYVNVREAWAKGDEHVNKHSHVQLRCMAEGLAYAAKRRLGNDVHVAIADSGSKGLHVYVFTGPVECGEAKAAAIAILQGFGVFEPSKGDNFYRHKTMGDGKQPYFNLEIEIFPKQDDMKGKDFGNLMALPLGKNQKGTRPKRFLKFNNGYDQPWTTMDPIEALGGTLPWE